MSAFSEARRIQVVDRAGHRCEYCHLPTRGQVATFPIDHIIPRSAGGTTDLTNLALTCPHCNAHKWKAAEGTDPETNEAVPLFNPRSDNWNEHFMWSADRPGVLIGLTTTGRATIAGLCINDVDMISLRVLLTVVGIFVEANS